MAEEDVPEMDFGEGDEPEFYELNEEAWKITSPEEVFDKDEEEEKDAAEGVAEEEEEEEEDESGEVPETPPQVVAQKSIVRPANRTSRAVMTRSEEARLVASYASMLAAGAPLDSRIQSTSTNYIDQALAALNYRPPGFQIPDPSGRGGKGVPAADYEFPITVLRPMPSGEVEEWYVSELVLPREMEVLGL